MRAAVISVACLFLLAGASAQQGKPKASAVPSGKAVLEAYVSAWNRHDFAALDKLLTPDAVHEDVAQGVHAQGLAEIKKFMREEIEGEPDIEWGLTTVVEAVPLVAAEWTWTGTFTGDGPTGPVKGQRISGRGVSIVLTENGQIKRFTDYYDLASFFPKTSAANATLSDDDLSAAKQQVLDLEQEWVAAYGISNADRPDRHHRSRHCRRRWHRHRARDTEWPGVHCGLPIHGDLHSAQRELGSVSRTPRRSAAGKVALCRATVCDAL